MSLRTAFLILATALAASTPTLAQTDDTASAPQVAPPPVWTQGGGASSLAYAVFPPGVAMIARCQPDGAELLLQGLATSSRAVSGTATFDGGRARAVSWSLSGDGRYLIADGAAPMIRGLAGARSLVLTLGHAEPFTLALPDDGAPMAAVLSACGQSLDMARDEREPRMLEIEDWRSRPRLLTPSRASTEGLSGWAEVNCVTAQAGRLTECEVVAESPAGYGFGEAAARAFEAGRLEADTPPGQLVAMRAAAGLWR